MASFEWANPYFLLCVAVLPVVWFWNRKKKRYTAVQYSHIGWLNAVRPSFRQKAAALLPWLKLMALALIIFALARPRTKDAQSKVTAEGIDIILAIDISRSMLIEDMGKANRLEAAKEVAERFVAGRETDRVGLVVFAGKSFTQCPLTVDYSILTSLIRQVDIGMIEDGTAIGMGLVNSINRLRESKVKSKVIILLTDGQNNRGEIDPVTAAQIAKALGIRVYTVGAGKDGVARIPVDDPFFGRQYVTAEVKIDEETLRTIAETTGGQYFRATSQKMLEDIYDQIGQLEKTRIEVKTYLRYHELYPYLIIPALILLILYCVLSQTVFMKIP